MFNKNLKKKVAVLLTGVMVLGMSVTAFAKTGTAVESEGAGNFEGHVNRKVVDVTLPTVSANTTPFGFIYDAEGLLQETQAAYGAGYTFAGGSNVYFKTADKTFGDKSTKFTVSNNSSVSVNITLKVDVTPGEKDPALVAKGSLPANYNRDNPSSVSGDPSLYLGLIVGGDAEAAGDAAGTYVISGNGIDKTFNVAGVPGNYTVSINEVGETSYPHEYEFKIKDGTLAPWKAIDFQLEGAANIIDNAKGMTAPDLKVTWNYEGDDGDEGGDTPTPPTPSTKTGVASVLTYQQATWLALKGEGGANLTAEATSLVVNTKDVTAKAELISGYVAVRASDLTAAGVTVAPGTELSATYVVDGVTYEASYTP